MGKVKLCGQNIKHTIDVLKGSKKETTLTRIIERLEELRIKTPISDFTQGENYGVRRAIRIVKEEMERK